MFLMGIKMWWVRRFIAPIWNIPTEELICSAFGRHVSDRFQVVGGADPYKSMIWFTTPMQQRSKSGFIRDWLSATVLLPRQGGGS